MTSPSQETRAATGGGGGGGATGAERGRLSACSRAILRREKTFAPSASIARQMLMIPRTVRIEG